MSPFSIRLPSFNELPKVTRALVAVIFCGWLLGTLIGWKMDLYLGLVPVKVAGSFWIWQLFTYMAVHAGFWHFFFNTFMLWLIGPALEPVMGRGRFLGYFIICGAVAGLFTVLVQPSSAVVVVGASGALYGLLYAFAELYPGQTVYLYFLFPMTSRQLVALMAVVSLVLSVAATNSGTANFTHLSGLAVGWLYFKMPRWLAVWRERAALRADVAPPEARIDALLEKMSKKGQEALSKKELAELDEYARTKGGRA